MTTADKPVKPVVKKRSISKARLYKETIKQQKEYAMTDTSTMGEFLERLGDEVIEAAIS